ncbi:MAG: acyl-CoA thioesterase [Clostridiaceae bacterium]|jgi:acyl-CoA thioester hydrolase|nr:acyl-CoA thioesterase [Clostridiaceae bacterium]
MVSETNLIVRYQETDQMGIVHHSVYPIWFECGRTDLIKCAGMTYSQMEKEGVFLPLIELKCRYFYPANYEDEIVVKTGVLEMSPSRIIFKYSVYKKGFEKEIASGQTEHAWVNDKFKPVNLKKYRPEIYMKIKKYFKEDESNGKE